MVFDFPSSLQYGDQYHASSIISFEMSSKYCKKVFLNSDLSLALTKFHVIISGAPSFPKAVYRFDKRWWEFTFEDFLPQKFDFHILWTGTVAAPTFRVSTELRTRTLHAQGGPGLFPCVVVSSEAFFETRIRTGSKIAVITPEISLLRIPPMLAGFVLGKGYKKRILGPVDNQTAILYSDTRDQSVDSIVWSVADAQVNLAAPWPTPVTNWNFFKASVKPDFFYEFGTLAAIPVIHPVSQSFTLSISIKQTLLALKAPLNLIDFGSKFLAADITSTRDGLTADILAYYALQQSCSTDLVSLSVINWVYNSNQVSYGMPEVEKYVASVLSDTDCVSAPVLVVLNNTVRVKDVKWVGVPLPTTILFANGNTLFLVISSEVTSFKEPIASCNYKRRSVVMCDYDTDPELSNLSCLDKAAFLKEGYMRSMLTGLQRYKITFMKCLPWYHVQAVYLNSLFFLVAGSALQTSTFILGTVKPVVDGWFSDSPFVFNDFSEASELAAETEYLMCQNVFFYNISVSIQNQVALERSCGDLFSQMQAYKEALNPTLLSETIPTLDEGNTLLCAIKVLAAFSPSLLQEFQFLVFPRWKDKDFVLTGVASVLPVTNPVTDSFLSVYPTYSILISKRRGMWSELNSDLQQIP
eukprot:TRINITY_DN22538_c0_g1_i1.p1 TRINITY_DN22538_c0_g1~~TRINITY_DN22538_c0_g1_i1.p1  ORF type:complete len:639 (+),score=49.31 TRINITY_DN22538_c0_g1_i1:3-1919(+)